MGVVLDELADAGQAAQRPGALISMQPAELAVAEGQVAVRTQVRSVDVRALGAVHRLEAERLAFGLDQEHVVPIEVPVAGLPPQALADEDRGADLLIAAPLLKLAHGRLQGAPDALALGVPEGRAGADVVEAVQVELDAEAPMVALLRFGAAPEVGVQVLLGRPGGTVDALEHRTLFVAPPVGAGRAEQLERADLAGARHMRTPAQVDERALPVERRRRDGGPVALRGRDEVVDDLDLERLVAFDHERTRFGRCHLAQLERMVGGDARAHARLDHGQVVRRQRARQEQVVVEAVVDDRTDPELRAREQVHHRFGEDVGGRVAHRTELAGRAMIHQLGRGSAFGRVEPDLDRLLDRGRAVLFLRHPSDLLENHKTPRPSTGREVHSRGPTRLHEPCGSRARGRANGRRPGRFAGRSRVVSLRLDRRASSRGPALS